MSFKGSLASEPGSPEAVGRAKSATPRCRGSRAHIRQHFEARISPRNEAKLRAHLLGCAECRHDYERHLILAEVDPTLRPAKERIAAGLGLSTRRRIHRAPAAGMAAAACAALVAWTLLPRDPVQQAITPPQGLALEATPSGTESFKARGGVPEAPEAALFVYRIPSDGATEPVGSAIRADDELAFSYTNGRGFRHLLVFGMDDHGRVYWYYPAWTDGEDNPKALPIQPGPERRELPDAVRHSLGGSRLRLMAVFTDVPLSVREVEDRLRSSPHADGELIPGSFSQRIVLEVEEP